MSRIILYDLPSKGRNACWSLNPWKTRAALNFKGVDYKTEWIEYPNIESTLKETGLEPNDPPLPNYTIPAIRFENGEYEMKSEKIIWGIEKRYPEPPLYLDSPYHDQAIKAVQECFQPAAAEILPRVPGSLLNPPSAEYFESTRPKRFGCSSLKEVLEQKGGDPAWKAAEPGYLKIGEMLKQNPEGPYFMGKTPSYADIVIASFFYFLKRIDQGLFDRAVAHDPVLKAHYDASIKWFERDDH